MNVSTPSDFPALSPHLIPAMSFVRWQIGAALHAGVADYALRAATLSHSEAATVLQELRDRLPQRDTTATTQEAPATRRVAGRLLADDAVHDRYFHVCRVSQSQGSAFLRSTIMAATLFHTEMASAYGPPDGQRFAAVGSGFSALLGQIGAIRVAPVEHTAAVAAAVPPALDPMRRWVLGHQIFAALTQGIIFALQDFEVAFRDLDSQRGRDALKLAADLLMASATAFRFTADFPPSAYSDVVRPSMMAEHVGEGFSGLLSVDHRQLVALLVRTRPLLVDAATRFASEHKRLTLALNHVYDDHKFVCAQFDGAKKPSLRCPNSSPLPGVEQLERYQRARVGLLRPDTGTDAVILE
jgi:hypothetical protein